MNYTHFDEKNTDIHLNTINPLSTSEDIKSWARKPVYDDEGNIKAGVYQCNECDYSSTFSQNNLDRHFNSVHKKIKPFSCDQCKYSSAYKYDLAKHIKTHDKSI